MSDQGRPPRASARRPPGEDKALAGSAVPSAGALAVAARRLGMSEEDISSDLLGRRGAAWSRCAWGLVTPVSRGPRPRCRRSRT